MPGRVFQIKAKRTTLVHLKISTKEFKLDTVFQQKKYDAQFIRGYTSLMYSKKSEKVGNFSQFAFI